MEDLRKFNLFLFWELNSIKLIKIPARTQDPPLLQDGVVNCSPIPFLANILFLSCPPMSHTLFVWSLDMVTMMLALLCSVPFSSF